MDFVIKGWTVVQTASKATAGCITSVKEKEAVFFPTRF